MSTLLNLDLIRTDGGTQPRAGIDYDAVDDYTEAMMEGTTFPPVVVFYDGSNYWLADGFHRFKAAEQARASEIACDIQQGTQQDAQWYSFGANKTNGLRRTNEDKQRAVKAALAHAKSAQLSDNQIAKHVGVHHDTVSEWRKKLAPHLAESERCLRTVTRGGTTYQQNVANIGHNAKAPKFAAAPPSLPSTSRAEPGATTAPPAIPAHPAAPAPAPATVLLPVPAPAAEIPQQPTIGQCLPQGGTHPDQVLEWCQRVVSAGAEVARCPVSAAELARFIATSESSNAYFNHLEKAHEILTAVLQYRR